MVSISTKCLVFSSVLAASASWSWAQDDATPAPVRRAVRAVVSAQSETAGQSYWIGIMGVPADDVLKSHLKLDAGLVVQHVVPDSPAGKAGLEENDILLRFNKTAIKGIPDLAKAIAANGGKEATITLLRRGDDLALQITPAERPVGTLEAPIPPLADMKQVQDWLKKIEKGELGDDPLRMLFVRPGIVIPEEIEKGAMFVLPKMSLQLPNDTTVTITREGDNPATAIVKRGDESWKVTEEEVQKLPEDLRPAVKAMLMGANVSIRIGDSMDLKLHQEVRKHRQPEQTEQEAASSASDIEALQKQIEQLKKQLQESGKQFERLQRKVEDLE